MYEKIPLEERRRRALRGIGPFVIFTVCFGLVAGFFFFRTFRAVNLNSVDPVSACQGLPVNDVSQYEETPGIKPAVAFRQLAGDQYVVDNDLLLDSWRAADAADIEVVVCLREQMPLEILDCDSGESFIYGNQVQVDVVAAATGAPIDSKVIKTVDLGDVPCLNGAEQPEARVVTDGEINNFLIPILNRQ